MRINSLYLENFRNYAGEHVDFDPVDVYKRQAPSATGSPICRTASAWASSSAMPWAMQASRCLLYTSRCV